MKSKGKGCCVSSKCLTSTEHVSISPAVRIKSGRIRKKKTLRRTENINKEIRKIEEKEKQVSNMY